VLNYLLPAFIQQERRKRLNDELLQESQDALDLEAIGWVQRGQPHNRLITRILRTLQVTPKYLPNRAMFVDAMFIDLSRFTSPSKAIRRLETVLEWMMKEERMRKGPKKFGQSGCNLAACHKNQLNGTQPICAKINRQVKEQQLDTEPCHRPIIQDAKTADYHAKYLNPSPPPFTSCPLSHLLPPPHLAGIGHTPKSSS
jgi:hypothetical protein